MKTIIVPTDFSNASVNAAFYAAAIALHTHADIMLIHVLPMPLTISEVPMPLDSYEIAMEESNRSLKDLKGKLESYSNDKLGINYRTTTNSFLDEIKSFNRQTEIFAMVMGTSGAGATEAFFLGSFSQSAAKNFTCPLIVVPPEYKYKSIEKIGLACDMENVQEHLPVKGLDVLFENFHPKLEVLYVSKPSEKMFPEVLSESKFIQFRLARYHPEIRITTNKDVKEGLEDFVRKNDIDLLLLLPKERNFVEALFHKSVTRKMVLHPAVPVIVVHG